jgi:predicted site-specific integrase-resolvase
MARELRTPRLPLAYSLAEAAESVGVSLSTLKNVIAAGDLNPVYVNSKPVITATELTAWLSSLPPERKTG